jgi:peroxiredoxin
MSQFAYRLTRVMLSAFLAVMAQASDGKTYSLSEFSGDKPVVIAFFPKAFTGG